MLPLAVRRACLLTSHRSNLNNLSLLGRAAAAAAAATSTSAASTATTALADLATSRRACAGQCRFSSSSRSSNSGSKDDAAGREPVHASAKSKDAKEAKKPVAATEKRRKLSKNRPAGADMLRNLPSVPNTSHMSEGDLGLAVFFSLHRPIHISKGIPKPVTEETFATLFAPGKARRSSDVTSVLSRAVSELEHPFSDAAMDPEPRAQYREDGAQAGYVQVANFQFPPYCPPPAPRPQSKQQQQQQQQQQQLAMSADQDAAAAAPEFFVRVVGEPGGVAGVGAGVGADDGTDGTSFSRVSPTDFSIEQTIGADGKIRFYVRTLQPTTSFGRGGDDEVEVEAEHVPPPTRASVERPQVRSRRLPMQRINLWRGRWGAMLAISVMRQRKLRMKKKKYKKLVKKQRKEKSKMDRS